MGRTRGRPRLGSGAIPPNRIAKPELRNEGQGREDGSDGRMHKHKNAGLLAEPGVL